MHLLWFICLTRDGSGPNCEISRDVGVPVCEAFVEADKVTIIMMMMVMMLLTIIVIIVTMMMMMIVHLTY